MNTLLFWFRRDLRLVDNIGLVKARNKADKLLTVFCVDPTHQNWRHRSGDRLAFKLNCLRSLQGKIRNNGGELIVRVNHSYESIPKICEKEDVNTVYWNRSYEPYEIERDQAVKDSLDDIGTGYDTFKDQVLFEKKEILTNAGDPYKVFTHYANKWKSRPKPEPVGPVQSFSSPEHIDSGAIPSVNKLGLETKLDDHDYGTDRNSALKRWKKFLDSPINQYETNRDYPAQDGTSKMSPYLRFGLVSPREIIHDCGQRIKQNDDPPVDSIETFVEEIIWRDFYQQILFNYPHVVNSNFKSKYDDIEWENHPDWFKAWKKGQTGFPIVDAAMRQLNRKGWMHNRLRMIVASFLTKDCMIHWKKGEQYFMNRLLDGDTGSNNGGWQWAASTGTDAVPYFRIFNPVTQSEKYDPNGTFIKKYCPELAELEKEWIHYPNEADRSTLIDAGINLGDDYPKPILDHSRRREIALEKFEAVT